MEILFFGPNGWLDVPLPNLKIDSCYVGILDFIHDDFPFFSFREKGDKVI